MKKYKGIIPEIKSFPGHTNPPPCPPVNDSQKMRRRILEISGAFITKFLIEGSLHGFVQIDEGEKIPDDAKIIDIKYNGFRDVAIVCIQSDEFELVEEGNEYPHLVPSYRSLV
jgi:hypothetical protein